jgi:hypothetical protein
VYGFPFGNMNCSDMFSQKPTIFVADGMLIWYHGYISGLFCPLTVACFGWLACIMSLAVSILLEDIFNMLQLLVVTFRVT